MKHFIMIILGKISEAEYLQFIDECKNAKETIFVELMVKMILNSESLIQKNGMVLLDKFNADVEFRTRKEPILEILLDFYRLR